eukprot:5184276-Pleurochrysis_carterae.AAC.1
MVELEEERTVGQARAVVGRPAEANGEAVPELSQLKKIFPVLEAALKVGHDHELAAPRGLRREDAKVDEVE